MMQVIAVLGISWSLRRGGHYLPPDAGGATRTAHVVLLRYFKRAPNSRGKIVDPVTRLPMLRWDFCSVPSGRARRRVDQVYDLVMLSSICRRVCILTDFKHSAHPDNPDRFLLNDLIDWAHAGERYGWVPGAEPNLIVTE